MAGTDDGAPPPGGGGKKIGGLPRNYVIAGLVAVVAGGVYVWWKKRKAASADTTATATPADTTTGQDDLAGQLADWQGGGDQISPSPAASGTGTGPGGSAGDASGGTGAGTGSTVPPTSPNQPASQALVDEAGNMHGISLDQARYLFSGGSQPYVYDPSTQTYVRWQGAPAQGQTYFAGPLNWQVGLQGGKITGGISGHPVFAAGAGKPAPKAKPKPKPPPHHGTPRRTTAGKR